MRTTGTTARGIRLPIISAGDDLAAIVTDSILAALENEQITLRNRDVVAITEAIVAKSQSNFVTLDDIARDIRRKFPEGELGLTFPILSRNRFLNILKGIARGADTLHILLSYPGDEMGNPICDAEKYYSLDTLPTGLLSLEEFDALLGHIVNPWTQADIVEIYQNVGSHIKIWFGNNVTDILKVTPYVLNASVHTRELNRRLLTKAGAKRVLTMADIMNESIDGSGYNEKYGVLGSNLSTGESLKLFPRDPTELLKAVQSALLEKTGVKVEVMVYGDGAFKDPVCGIWELADPVVSPGYTSGLEGAPNEIKIKYVADETFGALKGDAKKDAIIHMIEDKRVNGATHTEGTTPRRYTDLLGSLCDLVSGSGDKGTPVVLVQGYFDNYADE